MGVKGRLVRCELEQTAELLRKLEAPAGQLGHRRIEPELAMDARVPFSAILPNSEVPVENLERRGRSHDCDSLLADATMVPSGGRTGVRCPEDAPAIRQAADRASRRAASIDASTDISTDRMAVVRKRFTEGSIPTNVSDLLANGNRVGTQRAYQSAWKSWNRWCSEQARNSVAPSIVQVLEYLTFLYEIGRSYRTINIHRSMLSCTLPGIDGIDIGKHPMVSRLLKAVYNKRTPRAKYSAFWDADRVLYSLKELGATESLTLKQITLKTVLIVALSAFIRVSELASIGFKSLRFEETEVRFSLLKPRKAQSSGPLPNIILKRNPQDPQLCPVICLKAYVEKTRELRNGDSGELFIALVPPHKVVGVSSIARWIKDALRMSGIDTSIFAAHSTRGAAASKAFANGVSCDQILESASWKRPSTFFRFYNKRIARDDPPC